jgi:CheY-like chemotaxis protein
MEPSRAWQTYAMLGSLSNVGTASLLIVDDDEVSREVLATLLTIAGYTVRTARDGSEAVEMLDHTKYAPRAILVDLRMPGLSGAELIRQMRSRLQPGYSMAHRTLILAMSASDPRDGAADGADGFLRKPFDASTLEQALLEADKVGARTNSRGAQPMLDAADDDQSVKTPMPDRRKVDRHKMQQLRAMMPEASVREVYAVTVTDLRRRLDDLEAAILRGDAAAVRHIGHVIKGGCGMVGATEAARLGAMLETEGDQLDNASAIAAQLRSAIENLEDMLETEFPLR